MEPATITFEDAATPLTAASRVLTLAVGLRKRLFAYILQRTSLIAASS